VPAEAAGLVVAGGQSRRMGRDKAVLPWAGSTLLDVALERLRACCTPVGILCGPEPRYADRGVPLVRDLTAGAGPLGAVMSGLTWLGDGIAVFLAVDLPGVPVPLLSRLIALAHEADAVVPVTARGPEPLCAVYSTRCLEAVQRRVTRGELKMTSFWPDVRVREVGEDEISAFGDPAALFHNVNTPNDLAPC
jgi:molybdopterin-guanine dinucleotide biosynthesis protein A